MKHNIFSVGLNKKLTKDAGVFNLPSVSTCKYRTSFCKKNCYALRTEKRFGTKVINHRKANLKLSKRNDFVDIICQEIKKLKLNKVRIHESGDFYSVEYFLKWVEISRRNPDVIFLAYTKNRDLIKYRTGDNFKLYFSIDHTSDADYRNRLKNKRKAEIVMTPVKGEFNCFPMREKKEYNYCGSKCLHCWNGVNKVNLLYHY